MLFNMAVLLCPPERSRPSNLLLMNLKRVAILHFQRVRAVSGLYPLTIEQEADCIGHFSLPVAEGIHKLLKCRRTLDFEEHLIVVIGHFDIEMLGLGLLLRLVGSAR